MWWLKVYDNSTRQTGTYSYDNYDNYLSALVYINQEVNITLVSVGFFHR